MKILVTGATGFIGGYLVRELTEKGHEVLCTVRKTSDTKILEKMPGVSLFECDLSDGQGVTKVINDNRPEFVFHCAAGVMEKKEEKLNRVNAGGTYNICSASISNDVRRMIYISSVAVISGNEKIRLYDDMPYKATNAYGRSKILAEKTVIKFREEGLKTSIIRPCMVYGAGEPHMLYKIFGLIQKRLLFLPDIAAMESRLQLVAVENVVDSLVLAMEKEEALDGTFLIADKEILTIKQVLSVLYEYLEAGPPPILPRRLSNFILSLPWLRPVRSRFKDRTYDISRAQRVLGYEPRVSTPEGLRRTADEWKQRQNEDKKV